MPKSNKERQADWRKRQRKEAVTPPLRNDRNDDPILAGKLAEVIRQHQAEQEGLAEAIALGQSILNDPDLHQIVQACRSESVKDRFAVQAHRYLRSIGR